VEDHTSHKQQDIVVDHVIKFSVRNVEVSTKTREDVVQNFDVKNPKISHGMKLIMKVV